MTWQAARGGAGPETRAIIPRETQPPAKHWPLRAWQCISGLRLANFCDRRGLLYILAAILTFPLAAQQNQQTQQTPEDPGRPVLRRGGAAQKHEQVPAIPAGQRVPKVQPGDVVEVDDQGRTERVVPAQSAKPQPPDLIERAREAAFTFFESLPNFACDELISRYESKTLKPDWKFQDRFELELLMVGQKEDYRNLRRNGKPLKKGSPEDTGSWSSGEFGSVLASLFSSNTDAAFRVRGDSNASGMAAKVYDYSVRQPNSNWRIRIGYETKPAYKGAVWIDPVSARVLRVEMNSRQLPPDYAVDTVETYVDYGWVTIAGQRHLMPLKSEVLSCQRGTFRCSRNEIEFRNYRKFQVESQVMQVESEIKFPEEEQPAKKDEKKKP